MYTYDVYPTNGGKFSTKYEWSAESYLKSLTNVEDIGDFTFTPSVNEALTNVYYGNVRIAVIHKYRTPTLESICELLGIDFNDWYKSDPFNEYRFPYEIATKFCEQFKGTNIVFDNVEKYVKDIKDKK